MREALAEAGIKEGQIVLDCCCGSGTYTVPAAQLVGEKGLVYAIDISNSKLDDLKHRVDLKKLQNVEIIEKDVESKIPLPDRSVNVIFLYDIFWYFRPTENKLIKLLQEVYRVARRGALVSVYPTHVSSYELEHFKNEMRNKGFRLDSTCSRKLVHEGNLERGRLLNFKKESKKVKRREMKLKELFKKLGIEKDNSEDLHITRSFSTLAAVSKGKVIKMTDPFLKYCPLFIWLEIYREKELGKIEIKTSIEKKISKFGYFTKKRRLHPKKIAVPYGASEMIMYAMKKRTMDCAVVVCDGAGTVIVPEPEIVQGIGARMNGLFYTSPIAETIDKLRNSNCQIVFPEARIDQVKDLEKAVKLGYKNIAVTISGFLGDGLSKIREIEKKYNVSATVMIVCTTGVSEEEIKEIGKYADIIWSCASEGIRETISIGVRELKSGIFSRKV